MRDLSSIHDLHVEGEIASLGITKLRVPPGQEETILNALRRYPEVEFAELDQRVHAAALPNDPYLFQQWGLTQIEAPAAWDVVTGTEEIVIGLLDSGIDLDHPDLADKIWINAGEVPGNGIDDDGNGKIDDINGWHFYHNDMLVPREDANVADDHGHGSHVGGIAAASANNGIGIAGVAWEARLMPVKVLDEDGNGLYSEVAAGIAYAVDNGARILNLSLGGDSPSETLKTAIDDAVARGVLVVAATGNSSGPVLYPAAYPSVLAVAATDMTDNVANFSNFGPQVDLAAPGVGIYSTWRLDNYFTQSGTSMSTAYVSGVAALVWSYRPALTADQVGQILCHTADRGSEVSPSVYTGWGRVNARRAVAWRPSVHVPFIVR